MDSILTKALIRECKALESEKNYTEAVRCYENILKYDPHSPTALWRCARAYYRCGNINGALEKISTLLTLYPDMWKGWLLRGICYMQLNDPENALAAFRTVLEICPDNSDAMYYIGILYVWMGDPIIGLEYFRKALKKKDCVNYWLGLAVALILAKKYNEAEQVLRGLTKRRGGKKAYFYLAFLHYKRGDMKEALKEIDTFLKSYRCSGIGLWLKVYILQKIGLHEKAKILSRRAKKYLPTPPRFDTDISQIAVGKIKFYKNSW